MYNLFHLGILLLGTATLVPSAPTAKNTFYGTLLNRCPTIRDKNIDKLPLFEQCRDYDKISNITEVNKANQDDIQCYIFFLSFTTTYCETAGSLNVKDLLTLSFTLDEVCEKSKGLQKANFVNAILTSESLCREVCSDRTQLLALPLCQISYHLTHDPQHKLISANSSNIKQDEANIHQDKPAHVDAPVDHFLHVDINKANTSLETDNKKLQDTTEDSVVKPGEKARVNYPSALTTVKIVVSSEKHEIIEDEPLDKVSNPETVEKPVLDQSPPIDQSKDREEPEGRPEDGPIDGQNADKINEDRVNAGIDLGPDNDDDGDDFEKPISEDKKEVPVNDAIFDNGASKPETVVENDEMDGDSNFFTYFMIFCLVFVAGYVCYHNKQKILALFLEGRRAGGKRQYKGRRPNSAAYHKLDSNLEEAINSSCNKNSNNVIY